jgi:hypothetical protein
MNIETRILGREPGRSTVGRLKLFARRGRFSPFYSFESRRGSAPVAFEFGERPPGRRHLTRRLRIVVTLAMAGIIGVSLIGLPVHAAGKARPKKKPAQTKQVSKPPSSTSKGSSGKAASRTSDYKSKYRKKPPPQGGGRPQTQKKKQQNGYKPKERPTKYKDFTGDGRPSRRKQPAPAPRPRPGYRPPPAVDYDPGVIIYPYPPGDGYLPPPGVPDPPTRIDYEDPYLGPEPSASAFETASLLFAATSVAINYAFIREGQIGEFAAGAGFVFGLTSLISASKPNAQHPILGYLLGGASIAFAVWNLAGGMDNSSTYDQDPVYGYASPPTTDVAPAGVTAGWSFTF